MLEDLFNSTQTMEVNGKVFSLEYNHKSYAVLETLTGKGLFKLKDLFINQNNLSFQDSIEIVCCACLKNHTEKEVTELRDYLTDNLGVISSLSQPVLYAFIKPLLPPEIMKKFVENSVDKNKVKKKMKNMNG